MKIMSLIVRSAKRENPISNGGPVQRPVRLIPAAGTHPKLKRQGVDLVGLKVVLFPSIPSTDLFEKQRKRPIFIQESVVSV